MKNASPCLQAQHKEALNKQALNALVIFNMLFENLIEVFFAFILIPGFIGINDDNGALATAIQTTRVINPNAARAS